MKRATKIKARERIHLENPRLLIEKLKLKSFKTPLNLTALKDKRDMNKQFSSKFSLESNKITSGNKFLFPNLET